MATIPTACRGLGRKPPSPTFHRQQLFDFGHQQYFRPDNMVVTIVGANHSGRGRGPGGAGA